MIGDEVERNHTPFGSKVYAPVLRVAPPDRAGTPNLGYHNYWVIIGFACPDFMIYRKLRDERVLTAETGKNVMSRQFFRVWRL